MKIESSAVYMSSKHSYYERYAKEESLRYWNENPKTADGQAAQPARKDVIELSEQALALLKQQKSIVSCQKEDEVVYEISEKDKQKLFLIQQMLETLTGKKFKFCVPEKLKVKAGSFNLDKLPSKQIQGQQRQGWGLAYDYRESYIEHEQMSFSAEGIVKTADGREINFNVQLSMSRTFAEQNSINIRAGDAKLADPLVINFGGGTAHLTDTKIEFDLDTDGTAEQISFVEPGSGFLALDKDGDGIISNGSELFGPTTGNGFSELAEYDGDNNGWIDENDSIYERLRIWTRDDDGQYHLFALGQKGIGAIYVGNLETPFSLKDSGNELQGQVRSTGLYLNEDGTAGTIQQVDLVV